MHDRTIEEKQGWLESFIQQHRRQADGGGMAGSSSSSSHVGVDNDDEGLDRRAFLVVLRHLADSRSSGSPQLAETWIFRMEKELGVPPTLSLIHI